MLSVKTLLPVALLFLFSVSCAFADAAPVSERAAYNFNAGWKLLVGDQAGAEVESFDDASWKPVTLPHAWNEDDAFRKSVHDLPTGIAWYRKHFKLPQSDTDKKVFLEFEGIRQGGEFYLNGKFIGRHENGVMAFGFDVTDMIKPAPAENVLAARIDNSWTYHEKATNSAFQWNDRNFYANYGGINKNVIFHTAGKLYQTLPLYSNLGTSGVYIYAQNFNIKKHSATIAAESEIKNEYTTPQNFRYSVVLADASGKIVKTFGADSYTLKPGETRLIRATAGVDGLHFWSWGYGYLYTVYTVLSVNDKTVDVVKTRTGFRKTEFAHGMMRLNDRAIQLKGYAQRTTNEWPAIGLSVPPWMSDWSNRLIVEGNGNLVRWMHVTPWKQDVESCDRVGLMESLPAGDSEKDVTGRRWEQRREVMRDAIIYNRNNPSVLFYESGNNAVSDAHMQQMKDLRDKWDPHGGRAAGSRNMQDSKNAEYGGEMLYINKSATKPMWQMEYSRDEALRKYWDEQTPPFHKDGATAIGNKNGPSYNRNQDSFAIEDVTRWYDYWRERPGTGVRVNGGGVNIIFSDSNTHYRGDQNYRRSGEVDAVRLPKDGFYAHQVIWDGWVDIEHPRTFLIGHWNYAPGTVKTVTAVSSAEKVELFVNGVSKGFGTRSAQFLFTFPAIAFQPGVLRAVGYTRPGKILCEDQKKTMGAPAALRLTPHTGPGGLRANGADIAFVDIEVVDKAGNRCPTALNPVTFTLTGPAEWRGGIAQDDNRPDNYILSTTLPVECGVNRVLLRSLPQAGKITLHATASGLSPATVELVSQANTTSAGLSPLFPSENLPSYLERGPTPESDSIHPTRTPLTIARVTAGAKEEKATLSFDDNEATSWSNDGKRATAWIQYDLAQAATISEVTLKLGGWRQRSYPVRITLDGQEVFSGETPRSLGYVTLTLKPRMGKSLRIALVGASKERDGFDIVEITGKADAAPKDDPKNVSGTLTIVEVELYSPLAPAGK